MDKILLYPIGISERCRFAAELLQKAGFALIDHPSPDITHILLDIPSFQKEGLLQDGSDFTKLLSMLPKTITVIGGNLDIPALKMYKTLDLLQDPYYLAKNAAITAACALQATAPYIKTTFQESTVLILGWGRIGKHLAKLFSSLGSNVIVAARKESDRAMLETMGYQAIDFSQISKVLHNCSILYNTVPDLPMAKDMLKHWPGGIAIDLASYPGMQADNVIPARGLPGKYAPESAGKLIAETVLRNLKEDRP